MLGTDFFGLQGEDTETYENKRKSFHLLILLFIYSKMGFQHVLEDRHSVKCWGYNGKKASPMISLGKSMHSAPKEKRTGTWNPSQEWSGKQVAAEINLGSWIYYVSSQTCSPDGPQSRVHFHISFHLFILVSFPSLSCLFFLIQMLKILIAIVQCISLFHNFFFVLIAYDVVILSKISQFAYVIY